MTNSSLRDVLEDLASDPEVRTAHLGDVESFLASEGFHDLDPSLIAEAIVSVAANLPVGLATHLSAYTVATSPLPGGDGAAIDDLNGLRALIEIPLDAQHDLTSETEADRLFAIGSGDTQDASFQQEPDSALDRPLDRSDGPAPYGADEQEALDTMGDPFDLDSPYEPEPTLISAEDEGAIPDDIESDVDFLDG